MTAKGVVERSEARGWIITVFSVGNLLLIGLFALSPYLRPSLPGEPEPPEAHPEPDAELWEHVVTCMAQENPI